MKTSEASGGRGDESESFQLPPTPEKREAVGMATTGGVPQTEKAEIQTSSGPDIVVGSSNTPRLQQLLRKLEEISEKGLALVDDKLPRDVWEELRECRKLRSGESDPEMALHPELWLKVLRACGNVCKGMKRVDLKSILWTEFESISCSELEACLQPLQSSTTLEHLDLSGIACVGTQDGCIVVADVLRANTTLQSLDLRRVGMRADGLARIASALDANSRSALRKLILRWNPIGNEEGGRQLQVILRALPQLRELDLTSTLFDEGGAKHVGEALARHGSLERISVGRHKSAGPARGLLDRLLREAFLGSQKNTSIQHLTLSCTFLEEHGSDGWEPLTLMLRGDLCPRKLGLLFDDSNGAAYSKEWKEFMSSIEVNSTVKSLQMSYVTMSDPQVEPIRADRRGLDADAFMQLVEPKTSGATIALEHLDIDLKRMPFADWVRFLTALRSNSRLTTIELGDMGFMEPTEMDETVTAWVEVFRSNSTLKKVKAEFQSREFGEKAEEDWKRFWISLQENTTLTALEISSESIEGDGAFRECMAMLLVNSSLRHIKWSYGVVDEGKEALIQEALKRKARQQTYVAEFQREWPKASGSGWKHPTTGRIFLCGFPEAGKTRLADSMLLVTGSKSTFERLLDIFIRRTEGIEIHALKESDTHFKDLQISLWDLAGQEIFRALHEYLFPKLNRACVFIFVFSLVDPRTKQVKRDVEGTFEKEFSEWLRFLASNSDITGGYNLPQVLVVITHKDLAAKKGVDLGEAKMYFGPAIVDKRTMFQNVIHILESGIEESPDFFYINAHEKDDVKPIVNLVDRRFRDTFQQKLFKVPRVCCEMSSFLAKWVSKRKYEPLMTFQNFKSLCVRQWPYLKGFSDDLLRAMADYLHDVGTVMHFGRDCDLMVVNPNWLTNVFLGRMIGIGNNFQQPAGKSQKFDASEHGVMRPSEFRQLLRDDVLEPLRKEGYVELGAEQLQTLIERMDLCYGMSLEGKGISHFFVPTIFQIEEHKTLPWPGSLEAETSLHYLGLRIRCKDSQRTTLSGAFFSRFQVTLRRKLMEQNSWRLCEDQFNCRYNLIIFYYGGHEILVENDGVGDHVDILVQSSLARQNAWTFVSEYFVKEMMEFCASPKGCPGVELVVDLLRTDRVKSTKQSLCRSENLAVSRAFLMEEWKAFIRDLVDKGGDLRFLESFPHTWVREEKSGLQAGSEKVVDLLPNEDVLEIEKWVEVETKSLNAQVAKVQNVNKEIDETIPGVKSVASTTLPLGALGDESDPQSSETASTCKNSLTGDNPLENIRDEISKIRKEIIQSREDIIRRVTENVEGLMERLLNFMKQEIREMAKIQCTLQETLKQNTRKLDYMIGISESSADAVFPTRPYFTVDDTSMRHRIIAVVQIAKPVMLHFMCESRDGMHPVSDQPGFQLNVEKENLEWLRIISVNGVKIMSYMLKAGLQLTTGLGSLVPQLELGTGKDSGNFVPLALESMTSFLEENLQFTNDITSVDQLDNESAQKAWSKLKHHLKNALKGKVSDSFHLYPVRYLHVGGKQASYAQAWLCENCMNNQERRIKRL